MGLPEELRLQDGEEMSSSQPVVSIGALRNALSEERISAYSTPSDGDELDMVARYLWNGALASTMVPVLHALEVTFRNNLFSASLKIVDESVLRFRDVDCWLDAEPSLLYEKEEENVEHAKHLLQKGKKPLTPGRLVSKLSFGFWVSLCRSPYEQGRTGGPALWPKLTTIGFPFLPRAHRSRPKILKRFDEHRDLRNRVFHHEPIWDRDLDRAHARALDTLSWMNKGLAEAVEQVSGVQDVIAQGPSGFRNVAERLVRI